MFVEHTYIKRPKYTKTQGEIRSLARIASDTTDAPFFTRKEMTIAVKTFKNDKAPGMNLIEVKVLKISLI